MEFLTPEVFNTIIILNFIVGIALVSWRFYKDMTRSMPSLPSAWGVQPDADTEPNPLTQRSSEAVESTSE